MMNFKQAWLALIGKLPLTIEVEVEKIVEKEVIVEVVKEAIGQASAVMLYGFQYGTGRKKAEHLSSYPGKYSYEAPIYASIYYFTCEEAHLAAEGKHVASVPCIRVGKQYFKIADVKPVDVAPKPKVAKGRK